MLVNRLFRSAKSRPSAPGFRPTARLSLESLGERIVPASLSVGDATVVEGDQGIQYAAVVVTLGPWGRKTGSETVSVKYATGDGTAVAGADYLAIAGTLTFAKGETSKTIQIPVLGDRLPEPDVSFFVRLSAAKGANIDDGLGVVTIRDDEPRISIGNVSAAEGTSGATPFTFTVSLSRACDSPVTVDYATADGSASAGTDYTAASGTVTFAPGQTSQTVTVLVNGDRLVEPNETFFVNLIGASSYAVIGGSAAVGTISDSSPRIWIGDAYNSGEETLTFLVSLNSPYDEPVTVNFATADGTAIAGVDYVATSGTLTFAPGETELVITVEALRFPIVHTEIMDFSVQLSGASANASITSAIGTGYFYRDFGYDGGYGDWDSGCGCYW